MIELSPNQISGLILAGGEGRRMGNQDKGLVELVEKPLVEYAIDCLQPLAAKLMISCNRNAETYARYQWPLIADDENWKFTGPMAGIYAALNACETDWLMVMPCDTPLMQTELMAQLTKLTDAEIRVHILEQQGWQPLHGLYHKDLLPLFAQQLDSGKTGMQFFLRQLPEVQLQVSATETELQGFRNTNNESELSQIEAFLRAK